jgi:hypothetical protein
MCVGYDLDIANRQPAETAVVVCAARRHRDRTRDATRA